ncbi:hypothetical protein GCM10011519_33120 [Marmoricola endophyticus]|uniref:Uncharacterized protein n=1 Tax=Marmoricola endophyticus TaxID=2040280 RepID=A0A917FA03_9ACTN|nr:Rv3235 family protein [Marmoricola endophyticus]GGF56535.1 hypothetical protein GCM10011519_33120 [Marmoricola endophyticus]
MTQPTTAATTTQTVAPWQRPGVAAVARLTPTDRPGVDGALALATAPTRHRSGAPVRAGRPDLRLLDGGQARTRAWTLRFVQVLVEVLGGDRGPQQLLRCTSPEVYLDLSRRSEVLNRVASPVQRRRRVRAQVRSVHVAMPTPYVAEICARVEQGGRSRALAGRLELAEGRWTCTALEFG